MAAVITPLLGTMSSAARFAWPFIQKAATEGLRGEEIITAIKDAGIPTFRRQDMLALVREATRGELLRSDIARWPDDMLLPIDRVRPSVTKIVAPFSYTLRLKVEDKETGRTRTITRQAHSQTLRSADQIVKSFIGANEAREQYESFTILDAEVIDAQRAGELGTI